MMCYLTSHIFMTANWQPGKKLNQTTSKHEVYKMDENNTFSKRKNLNANDQNA